GAEGKAMEITALPRLQFPTRCHPATRVADFFALTKPRVVLLAVFTALWRFRRRAADDGQLARIREARRLTRSFRKPARQPSRTNPPSQLYCNLIGLVRRLPYAFGLPVPERTFRLLLGRTRVAVLTPIAGRSSARAIMPPSIPDRRRPRISK